MGAHCVRVSVPSFRPSLGVVRISNVVGRLPWWHWELLFGGRESRIFTYHWLPSGSLLLSSGALCPLGSFCLLRLSPESDYPLPLLCICKGRSCPVPFISHRSDPSCTCSVLVYQEGVRHTYPRLILTGRSAILHLCRCHRVFP